MNKDLLDRIAKQLASDYLSCLDSPKKLDNVFIPSGTIVLCDASDEEFTQFRKSMGEFFNVRNRFVEIFSEKEIDPSKNHNYRIDVKYFLENPPRLY